MLQQAQNLITRANTTHELHIYKGHTGKQKVIKSQTVTLKFLKKTVNHTNSWDRSPYSVTKIV